jgi:hypothetical protein
MDVPQLPAAGSVEWYRDAGNGVSYPERIRKLFLADLKAGMQREPEAIGGSQCGIFAWFSSQRCWQ